MTDQAATPGWQPGLRRDRRSTARSLVALAAALGLLAGVVVVREQPAPTTTSAAGASAVAPAGGPVDQAVVRDQARRAAVTALLDTWATAVRRDDTAVLTTLFDPRADAGFAAAERARAANLAQVPLRDWGYEIGSDPAPTVPPALVASLGADEVWAPPVELRYAVAGADDRATVKPVGLVLARRGSTWRLVSDTAVAAYGRTTWRGPWDFGPVVARSSAQGVVLGHPGEQAQVDRLATELVTAVPAVTDLWGTAWPQHALVEVASTQAELAALVGTEFAAPGVAAVTTADQVDHGAGTATGVRVVFNPATVGQLDTGSLRVVLRHELTHVAARSVTLDGAPLWMLEGYADYSGHRGTGTTLSVGAPDVVTRTRRSGPPSRLPSAAEFSPSGDGSTAQLAYQLAWTFTLFVAQTHGEAALTAAYRAVAARADPSAAELDAELAPSLGVPVATLVQQWGAWLAARSG